MESIETKKSIEAFLSELKNRIELLSGKKVSENINNSKIDEINKILKHYNISTDVEITARSLMNVDKKDIRLLLSYVGQNNDSIDYMMSKVDEYYENIANIINKYICDFISIGTNQTQMFNEKITLYQKYIDLFEKSSFEEPFSEINEISRVMSEIGLLDEDKWRILDYIAKGNNVAVEDEDINASLIISREYDKISSYFENQELMGIVKSSLEDIEVDIDTIPTIAASIAEKTGVAVSIMTNIITIIIASNLEDRYSQCSNQKDRDELDEIISIVLNNIKPIHDSVYYEALDIKNEKLDFYYNSIEQGISEKDFKEYADLTLAEIEKITNSRESAIDLKELSVLKPIFETLETIDSLDFDSQEYQKAINILKKLNEQYKLLEEKKKTKEKIN